MDEPHPPDLGSLSTLLTLPGLSSVMRSLEVFPEDGQYPGCSLVSGASEDSDLSEALQGPSSNPAMGERGWLIRGIPTTPLSCGLLVSSALQQSLLELAG